jgi:uncharacterized SAM-binding protein YcdF (DUF218 family)
VLAWAVLAAVLFLWPPRHVPQHADAVIVLAGARGPRLTRGLALARRGVAPVLVVSDAWSPTWVEANRLCAGRPAPAPVLCFHPVPYSTRGEARSVARLAANHHWTSVLVVTSRYHIARAGILFDRCFGGAVYTEGAEQSFVSRLVAAPLETLKLAYAYLHQGC